MFQPSRAFRLRQQLPVRLPTRIPRRLQSQATDGATGEPMRIQPVRFKRRPLTYKSAVSAAVYAASIYFVYKHISDGISIEVVIEDGEEDKSSDHGQDKSAEQANAEEEEGEERPFYAEEDSTFIPMTWAKPLPRTFYKGSDPEWQEFLKVARDKARHKKIQDELVQVVYTGTQKHPGVQRQLGKDSKVGRYWLEIQFPDAPPQEYERSGVEIGDDFVAWSQQKVSAEQHWRLMRALWPATTFNALYATTKVLAGIQYRRAKQALGFEGKDPFSPEERFRTAMEMLEKQQQAKERKALGGTQTDPHGGAGPMVTPSSTAPASPDSSKPSPPVTAVPYVPFSLPMPPSDAIDTTDLPIALHVFRSTMSKTWNPKKSEPPRGSFVVQGLVEVKGTRGRFIFDVQSCYDPAQRKFVSVNAGVRGYKRWNQAPKGGP